MLIRASELKCKAVVNLKNGECLGRVYDFEIDIPSSQIKTLVIFGGYKCLGLLGRKKDICIHWSDISLIGEDTILVSCDITPKRRKRKR